MSRKNLTIYLLGNPKNFFSKKVYSKRKFIDKSNRLFNLDFEDLVDTIKKVNPNVKDIALQEYCLKYILDCYGIRGGDSDSVNKKFHQKLGIVGFSNKVHEFLKYLNETREGELEGLRGVRKEIGEMGYDISYGKKKRKEV